MDSMRSIAQQVWTFDEQLRRALKLSRSGLFRDADGNCYVRSNVPLGNKYSDEVIGIFADEADLDFYYKMYLNRNE